MFEVVVSIGTIVKSVEAVETLIILCAEVVQEVPFWFTITQRVFATSWNTGLTLAGDFIEVLVILAGELRVESVIALVVCVAFRSDKVESIFFGDTTWVFAATWDIDLALLGLNVEEFVGATSSLGVCSIVTLVVLSAEVVLQVVSGDLAGAPRLRHHCVGDCGVLAVQTGTDRLHADPHMLLVAGLDPCDKVTVGESVASLAVVDGIVLGREDDSGNGHRGVVLDEVQALANSWHEGSDSIKLAREANVSVFGDEWVDGVFDQQPVEDNALMETVEVLQLTGAQSEGSDSIAYIDLRPGGHGVNPGLQFGVTDGNMDP